MDNGLSGAPPILHNHIPLTPPPHTPLLRLAHVYPYHMILNTALFNQYTSHGVFWKFGFPLMERWGKWGDGEVGAPWWCNNKWIPLITWWEIRGHRFDDIMRKLGALDGAMENLGPLALWWRNGKLQTLKKLRGNFRELNDLMRKTGNWAPDDHVNAMEHWFEGPFDDAMGKLETLTMMTLGPLNTCWGNLGH